MPLTTLDPTTALLVIDLQNVIVAQPIAHPAEQVVQHTRELADAFRAQGLPVVLVQATGRAPGRTEQSAAAKNAAKNATEAGPTTLPEGAMDLVAGLNQQPTDLVVTKKSWSAFTNTDLAEQFQALGVTQVVLAGIATSMGVESSARGAYERGFNVTLALDAMSDMDAGAHEHSAAHVFPRLGETGTTAEVLELLARTRR
jgi:nicotinamidase-related amidase